MVKSRLLEPGVNCDACLGVDFHRRSTGSADTLKLIASLAGSDNSSAQQVRGRSAVLDTPDITDYTFRTSMIYIPSPQ
jgi:hypothetical protein